MAYIVMAYIVMAYIVMAYIVMAYIVMAYIVIAGAVVLAGARIMFSFDRQHRSEPTGGNGRHAEAPAPRSEGEL